LSGYFPSKKSKEELKTTTSPNSFQCNMKTTNQTHGHWTESSATVDSRCH